MRLRWRCGIGDVPLFALAAFVLMALIGSRPEARNACLWDSDTLRTEAKSAPGAIEAIVGRFDQYPPLYYEMRLARVEKEVGTSPDDLGLYDDAGVACDRLGRDADAIGWMRRKREALDRAAAAGRANTEHEYRYLANLGTFHAHRWVRGGKNREEMADLLEAQRLIAAAIRLNPDAHFGRERYQLLFIDWLIDPPAELEYGGPGHTSVFAAGLSRGQSPPSPLPDQLSALGYDDAEAGIRGLITLGAAWQSVDALEAYAMALVNDGHASLAVLAGYRADELVKAGMNSAHPARNQSGTTWALEAASTTLDKGDVQSLVSYYEKARTEAEGWRAARTWYIMRRLEAGRHPDTDDNFWDDWVEFSSMPTPPNGVWGYAGRELAILKIVLVAGGVLLVFLGGSAWFLWRLIKRRRRAGRGELVREASVTPPG